MITSTTSSNRTTYSNNGVALGRVEASVSGNQTAYDSTGRTIGRYDAVTNKTYNMSGVAVGQGNMTSSMVTSQAMHY